MAKRRAVSEVLGAILVALVTVTMGVAYAAYGLTQSRSQTASISDILRTSARAQRQLLTLTYYYDSGAYGKLHVYVYNIGSENSTLKMIIVGSQKYDLPNPNVMMLDAGSTPPRPIDDYTIQPKKLVELKLPQQEGSLDFVILTVEGGIFVWRLTL